VWLFSMAYGGLTVWLVIVGCSTLFRRAPAGYGVVIPEIMPTNPKPAPRNTNDTNTAESS
jgi:hypothetical protein